MRAKIWNDFFQKKFNESYLFFFLFFLILFSINLFHLIFSANKEIFISSYFFLVHLGQTLFTLTAIALLAHICKEYLKKPLHYLMILVIFLFMASYVLEALFVLIMDISFIDGLSIAFGADWDNFIELLYLSDLGLWSWTLFFMALFLTPVIGLCFYRFCEKIQGSRHSFIKISHICSVGLLSFIALIFLDLFSGGLSCEQLDAHKKMLPWKGIVFKLNKNYLELDQPIAYNSPKLRKDAPITKLDFAHKPNIYLFVCESLRDDFIDHTTAPNLWDLKQESGQYLKAISSANCTHLSWFSLFHSKYPLYWSYGKTSDYKEGSLPLQLMKEGGYKIHLYSSAQLRFYHFDEVIFGKNHYLADSYKLFPHYDTISAAEADEKTIRTFLQESLFHKDYGNLYIIFLDSTHFNYSWNEQAKPMHSPCESVSWKHRLLNDSKALTSLKNRYKNSINYIDSLYGNVKKELIKRGSYDESFIIFLGDHGEEFKEEGKLFHASQLNLYQTNIPLYMKLGKNITSSKLLSQVDVFPSIIDAISEKSAPNHLFDGDSVFDDKKKSYALSVRYNASFAPYKFMIVSENGHKVFEFLNRKAFFSSKKVKILSQISSKEKEEYIEGFSELFIKKNSVQ